MLEDEKGNKKWFSIDSKSFEISVEGEGKKMKGFITERRKGYVSWICLREEDLRNLLKGVEFFCKEKSKVKRVFDWKENGDSSNWKIGKTKQDAFFCVMLQMVMVKNIESSSRKARAL